ncbi:hypothetical protein [Candidatus Pyrohabitans sp.]
MSEVCVPHNVGTHELGSHQHYPSRTYSLLCFSEKRDISNYVLIPIEGAGFVVIKHEIDAEE